MGRGDRPPVGTLPTFEREGFTTDDASKLVVRVELHPTFRYPHTEIGPLWSSCVKPTHNSPESDAERHRRRTVYSMDTPEELFIVALFVLSSLTLVSRLIMTFLERRSARELQPTDGS